VFVVVGGGVAVAELVGHLIKNSIRNVSQSFHKVNKLNLSTEFRV
jgi:hypothetical protein